MLLILDELSRCFRGAASNSAVATGALSKILKKLLQFMQQQPDRTEGRNGG